MFWEMNLLKLIGDGLGFFMPLEPHHVFGVKPPGLFLQSFSCQILGFGSLQTHSGDEVHGNMVNMSSWSSSGVLHRPTSR